MPSVMSATVTIAVNTGRRIAISLRNMALSPAAA
jgi:hypothetical protein